MSVCHVLFTCEELRRQLGWSEPFESLRYTETASRSGSLASASLRFGHCLTPCEFTALRQALLSQHRSYHSTPSRPSSGYGPNDGSLGHKHHPSHSHDTPLHKDI